MLIHAFCKICEPEIIFVYFLRVDFCFDFFRTISGSQLLQNTWIIKQTSVLLWKNWRKYGCVSYSFSSMLLKSFSLKLLFLKSIFSISAKQKEATIVVRVGNNRPDLGVNPICNRFTGVIEEGRPLFLPCNPPMPGNFFYFILFFF